jgi:hypothetical protein
MRFASRTAGVALLAACVLALGATPALARSKSFQTPSHNIYCLYVSSGGPGAFLRCDVLSLNDVGFTLNRRGRGKRIRITDSVVNRKARVLRYGRLIRVGPFGCRSRRSGLTCKSRVSGHGFKLSRQRQRVF